MLLAAAAVQSWFRGDTVLAGGDLVPPLAPGADYRAHWNQFDNGAGTPSYAIIWLPYFEGLRAFDALGLGAVAFQRVWLTVIFAGATAATVYFVRGFVASPLAAAVAGVVSTFNAYRLTVSFDAVPLAAMIAAGVLGGLIVRAGRGDVRRPLLFGLASLSLGFVFVNAAHLFLVALCLALAVVLAWTSYGTDALLRIGRFTIEAAPVAVLLNLWWIVPAVLTLTGPVFNEQFTAPGVEQWAWTHARNTVPNILALTSFWAWSYPEYYPDAARLGRAPFDVLQYSAAAAAALGVLLARRPQQRLAAALAASGLVTIWILKGLKPPLSGTNRWLYDHIPGFWLLRDPSKARLVLVLIFALLAALAIDVLVRSRPWVAAVLSAAVAAATIAYAYPLLTGAVVPDRRPLLPSAHVSVPTYWKQAAAYIDAAPASGKAVVLPKLDYYQAPTTWGYYGASFLHQLLRRPVIEPLPGGYFASPTVSALVASLQRQILRRGSNVRTLLQALGARFVLVRRDLDPSFPHRKFISPARLARAVTHVPALRHVRSFGPLVLYEARGLATAEVYPATPLRVPGTSLAAVYDVAAVGDRSAIVQASRARGAEIHADALGFVPVPKGRVRAIVSAGNGGASLRLRARDGVRSLRLARDGPPLQFVIGTKNVLVTNASRRAISVDPRPTPRALLPLAFRGRMTRVPPAAFVTHKVGDCHRYDRRRGAAVGLFARLAGRGERSAVRLGAGRHSACVALPLEGPANAPLRLRLSYRTISGQAARVCLWERGPERCARIPPLARGRGWHRLDVTVTPDNRTRRLQLFLYADGDAASRTVTEYRDIRIARGRQLLPVGAVPVDLPQVTYRRAAPFEFRVHVRNETGKPFLLVLTETFASGWRLHASGRDSGRTEHLRVNGYANAWRIPWAGAYDVTIDYQPERWARAAEIADLVIVPLALLALPFAPLRRRWRSRR